jgi:iron complex outermembrane recepter protein
MALLTKGCRRGSTFRLTALAAVVSAMSTGAVMAQEPEGAIEEVLVTGSATGTMLRGVAPVGTNVVSLDKSKIEETGVSSSNDLLAQVPQVSSTFNGKPAMSSDVGQGFPMPKLRNLGVSGGSTTLVLLNGLRLPGSGIIQTVPDASVIPPGAIDRLEIVLDGGSSIYGSDAIGGVINFITRDRFEGAELQVQGDSADAYTGSSVNLTLGSDWGSGSGFVSLYHTQNDAIFGRDRDFITANSSAKEFGNDSRTYYCGAGASQAYTPNGAPPAPILSLADSSLPAEKCDETGPISFLPKTESSTIYASLKQALSDSVDLELVTFYNDRSVEITGNSGSNGTSTGYGIDIYTDQKYMVDVSGEVGEDAVHNTSDYDSFSFMPELTVALPDDWRLKLAYNYGVANTAGKEMAVNPDNDLRAGYFYGAVPLSALLNYYKTNAEAKQTHHQVRAVVDGDLFEMPAGAVKIATGVEFLKQNYQGSYAAGPFNAQDVRASDTDRDVSSAFIEVVVPVMDSEAGVMNVTGSTRYDEYNDVGSTTNPKFGIDYAPVDTLKFRAQWGTSFQAPSMADTGGALDKRAIFIPLVPWATREDQEQNPDGVPGTTVLLAGGSDDLKPESSESFSYGFEWTPDSVEGLTVNMNYFNTDYKDAITVAPFFTSLLFTTPALSSFYTIRPTEQQTRDLLEGYRLDGAASVDQIVGSDPYIIIDANRKNMQAVKVSGIDFDISKIWETNFGAINTGVAGTYYLNRETAAAEGAGFTDNLKFGEVSQFDLVGTIGVSTDAFKSGVRVLYSDGWTLDKRAKSTDPALNFNYPSTVTVNYYGSYTFGEQGIFEDVLVTWNIDNLLDEDPSFYPDSGRGYNPNNSNIMGRLFSLGVKVKM